MSNPEEAEIEHFWEENPCGDEQIFGFQSGNIIEDYEDFLNKFDSHRYKKEGHILSCLDNIDFKNKKVLEIGLGQGSESEQIIKRGAIWSGLDLTKESIFRVKKRFELKNIKYADLKNGSITQAPFDDNSFDIVFSHGVLHHVPDIAKAQEEISRILKPDGKLIAMLYAKHSLNYYLSIGFFRRLGVLFTYPFYSNPKTIVGQHNINAKSKGLLNYLRMENFIHYNTDGPLNPYSKVYTKGKVEKDFSNFKLIKSYKRFMHAPLVPLAKYLPLQSILGWHLWVHLENKK